MGAHASVSLISDGNLLCYLEEERLTGYKRDSYPFKSISYIFSKFKINEAVLAGINSPGMSPILPNTEEDMFSCYLRKLNPSLKISFINNHHHLTHASSAFYNSGFKKAIGIVIDGAGSKHSISINNEIFEGDEVESIFECSYPSTIKKIHGVYLNTSLPSSIVDKSYIFQNYVSIGKSYETISTYLGFEALDGGKTMGLASYGKYNSSLPDFFINSKGNKNLFFNFQNYPLGHRFEFNIRDFISTTNLELNQDIAWKIQHDTQQLVGNYIEKSIQKTGLKQVCCAGGYFLNCVTNYYLLKRFPDIEFYFEPSSHDGGISLGAALYRWYEYSGDITIRPRKTLYDGPRYLKEEILEGIKNYVG